MGMTEKVKILLIKKGMTASQLAEKMDTSQPNLSKKLRKDNLTENDLHKIAEALEVKYEGFFFLNDGDKI